MNKFNNIFGAHYRYVLQIFAFMIAVIAFFIDCWYKNENGDDLQFRSELGVHTFTELRDQKHTHSHYHSLHLAAC